jgi:hypothetical protein
MLLFNNMQNVWHLETRPSYIQKCMGLPHHQKIFHTELQGLELKSFKVIQNAWSWNFQPIRWPLECTIIY